MKLKISKQESGIYYHGSPFQLEYLKENCDFTPYKEVAVAFGSKPISLSVNDDIISFNGSVFTVYLYQIDEDIKYNVDFFDRPNSSFEKGYELRAKRNIKLKLIEVICKTNSPF